MDGFCCNQADTEPGASRGSRQLDRCRIKQVSSPSVPSLLSPRLKEPVFFREAAPEQHTLEFCAEMVAASMEPEEPGHVQAISRNPPALATLPTPPPPPPAFYETEAASFLQ